MKRTSKLLVLVLLSLALMLVTVACGDNENKGNTETDRFTVTFNTDGGSSVDSQTVDKGGKATRPLTNPTKMGYTFDNWYKDSLKTDLFDFSIETINSNTTIYAKWNENIVRFTVSFDTDNGSSVASQTINKGGKVIRPSGDPTKDGFYFDNWYKNPAKTVLFDFTSETINSDTTIYAKWSSEEITEFTVSFDTDGGSSEPSQTIDKGQNATRPKTNPTKSGHTFDNWYKDSAKTVLFNFDTETINSHIIIYAKWNKNAAVYTVSFNVDGGSSVPSQSVEDGGKATRPTNNPTKSGYTFDNWYKNSAKTVLFDFNNETINSHTTIYAKWNDVTANSFQVTFNTDGGSTVPSQSIEEGGKVTRPKTNPTKSGYTFDDWYKDSAKTVLFDFDTEIINSDITIYAKFTEKSGEVQTYIVSFNTDGGSAVSNQTVNEGGKATRPLIEPVKTGYTLDNWYKDSAKTVLFDFNNETINSDTTIYAKWNNVTINNFQVTFNTDGGSSVVSQTVEGGGKAVRPTNNPTKNNCDFDNWYKDSAKTIVFNFDSETISSDTIIYAKWNYVFATSYQVTFNTDGGSNVASQTVNGGSKAERSTKNPTKVGYTFDNWYKNSAKTIVFNFDTEIINSDITVYAKWNLENYIITYALDGGTNHTSNPSGYTIESSAIILQNPTRTGYNFVGWTEGSSIQAGSTGNKTFTAQWTVASYSISYNLNGGTNHASNPSSYTIESAAITLQNPTRAGYTFIAWTEGSSIQAGSSGNKIFTAQWTVITYSIIYNLNGGTNHASNPSSYTIESATKILQNPTRAGYSFVGWTEGSSIPVGSTGNKTFTAQWTTLEVYTIGYNLSGGTNHASNPTGYTIESSTIILQNPTKAGYTFAGWTEGNSIPTGSTGNKTFTAQWTIVSYTINYNLNGGMNHASNPTGYTVESAAITLQNPTRTGYAFAAWTEGSSIPSGSIGNKIFTAQWTANIYTITYNLNGGTNHASNPNNYTIESLAITLQNPAKAGYTFVAWTEGNSISTGSTGNKTFTAQWTATTYTITYNLNGGTNHASNSNSYTIVSAAITLQNPTRAGYSFAGWVEGSSIPLGSTGNKTFTAQWVPITYTITYNLSGGINHASNPNSYTIVSATISLQNPTKLGYSFASWAESSSIPTGSTGNKTFTAQWTIVSYTITYKLNGGTNHTFNPNSYTIESAAITLQNPTRTGYTFAGWTEGSSIQAGSSGNKTFTAEWAANTYKITYDYQSATAGNTKQIDSIVYGNQFTLAVPIKTNYTFGGWYSAIGGGGTKLTNAVGNSLDVWKNAEDITVYAYWLGTEGLAYTLINGGYSVSKGSANTNGSVSIPEYYLGKPVTSIGDYAFYDCSILTSVTIPDSVTSIGDWTFYNCSSLTSITIPDSVTIIGEYAFYNCINIISARIGNNVIRIGDSAFHVCKSLTSITIPDSVTSIGRMAFSFCEAITSLIIPDTVTSIGYGAFSDCSDLTNVTIGNLVTSISFGMFALCSNLTSITIPDSVISIEGNAFYSCSSLTNITIPDSVTSIGQGAFFSCSSLTSIMIPNSETSIDSSTFYSCSSLTSITIPNSVTNIGDSAFYGCSKLTSITIPDSVTNIGFAAFSGCSGLTSITIGSGVTSIGNSAFFNCGKLTSVTIPDSVTSIGNSAFYYCSSLTSVTFQNTTGWYVTTTEGAVSGTNITTTNESTNATYLKSTYRSYYWYRK